MSFAAIPDFPKLDKVGNVANKGNKDLQVSSSKNKTSGLCPPFTLCDL